MPGLIKDLMEGTRVWAGIETCLNMREKQFAAKELWVLYPSEEILFLESDPFSDDELKALSEQILPVRLDYFRIAVFGYNNQNRLLKFDSATLDSL